MIYSLHFIFHHEWPLNIFPPLVFCAPHRIALSPNMIFRKILRFPSAHSWLLAAAQSSWPAVQLSLFEIRETPHKTTPMRVRWRDFIKNINFTFFTSNFFIFISFTAALLVKLRSNKIYLIIASYKQPSHFFDILIPRVLFFFPLLCCVFLLHFPKCFRLLHWANNPSARRAQNRSDKVCERQ